MVSIMMRRPVLSFEMKFFFNDACFVNDLRFPIHPSIMKLLHQIKIALRQLVPNSWRIIITYMKIWLFIQEGDMKRVDEFVHLYHLKESKQLRYYKVIPWER